MWDGDINYSTSMPNYCNEPYSDIDILAKKKSSAWAEVSTDTCFPAASIMAPGGRDLGDFRVSGRAGDI